MSNSEDRIIFSLQRGNITIYRLIARTDGLYEEWNNGISSIFDRDQMIAMAKSILAWEKSRT